MIRTMRILVPGFLSLCLFAEWLPSVEAQTESVSLKQQPVEGTLKPFLGPPEFRIKDVFKGERFPNVVVSMKGTVIVTWGNKSVRAKRSTDSGKTWSDEILIANPGFQGGGLTVDETTGDILTFVEDHHPPAKIRMFRSTDDGLTWNPEDITIHPDSKGHLPSMHMNDHGITLRHGPHKGRLLRPTRWYAGKNDRSKWPEHYTNAMFSDDHGKTWRTSEPFPENGTGEATVAELSNGRIYYNSRIHWNERPRNTRRREAWSDDGGATWKDWRIIDALPDGHQHRSYGCMGGLTRLPVTGKDLLVFSNIETESSKREKGTVWASFDGGKTWPIRRLVFEGAHGYSSLTSGRPGTNTEGMFFHHFESGGGSKVACFNLSWILKGKPTDDGKVPAELLK